MHSSRWWAAALVASGVPSAPLGAGGVDPVVPFAVTYDDPASLDEDEMCVWVHPDDPSLSTVIVADKLAGIVFVYDLAGTLLHATPSPGPRRIDARSGIQFDGGCIDVVAFNDRVEERIRVYRVDPASRALVRIDDGQIDTESTYGFSLYRHQDGRLFALTGDDLTGLVRQFLLFDDGLGQMTGAPTGWQFQETTIEGIAGDDETGSIYVAEEQVGIWRVNALDDSDRTLIAAVGDGSGLEADIEGLAIYYAADGGGYIIASSQGGNQFTVLERQPPHLAAGNFHLDGVVLAEGVDVLNVGLGEIFPEGVLLAHNGGSNCCSVIAARWDQIAAALGLVVDTKHWDPRRPCAPLTDVVHFEETAGGGAVAAAIVTTDEPLAAAAFDLYLAAVATRPPVEVASVTGLGLSWTPLRSQCSGRNQTAISVWMARGLPLADGAVTADLAEVPSSAVIVVNRFSNVASDDIGPIVSGNTNGPDGACFDGVDGDAYSFDLGTTVPGAFVFGAATMRNRAHTPGAGYRERAELAAGSLGAVSSVAMVDLQVWTPQPAQLQGTFSNPVDWAVIGFEIRPAPPFPFFPPLPRDLDDIRRAAE